MTDVARERPSIHVGLAAEADASLYRWVEVGAEEEGLPTDPVASEQADVIAAAFAAAQSSRFGIGVGVGAGRVVLHEAHMPPTQPVLALELGADAPGICRLIGGNAARLVVRLPLRFADEIELPPEPPQPGTRAWSAAEVRRIAQIVAGRLRERGYQ